MCQSLIGGRIPGGPKELFKGFKQHYERKRWFICFSYSWETCMFHFYLELIKFRWLSVTLHVHVCMCMCVPAWLWMCVNLFHALHNILWVLSKCQNITPGQPFLVELMEPQMNLLILLCSYKPLAQSHLTFFIHFNKSKVTLQSKRLM